MPITKSVKKSLRSSRAKQARNESLKKNLEINLKKVTKETTSKVVSLVDKASKRGLIHKNKASRVKSQLSRKFGPVVPPRATDTKIASKPKTPAKPKKVTKKID